MAETASGPLWEAATRPAPGQLPPAGAPVVVAFIASEDALLRLESDMLRRSVGAAALSLILSVSIHPQAQQATTAQPLNAAKYDEFIRLSVKQRHEQFSRLDSVSKAFLVRTHAERWLAANKAQLSRSEFSVFQEGITFITPQLYDSPTTLDVFKRTSDIKGRIRCRVSPTDAAEAFSVFSTNSLPYPRVDARWSYLKQAECWMAWHAESVIGYIPTFPK